MMGKYLETLKWLDKMGHQRQDSAHNHVSQRYQWKGMYTDIANYVKYCKVWQKRVYRRLEEPLYPTWTTTFCGEVGLVVVKLLLSDGWQHAVFSWDYLSRWVEGV